MTQTQDVEKGLYPRKLAGLQPFFNILCLCHDAAASTTPDAQVYAVSFALLRPSPHYSAHC